jgi:drug/metabolite transporter (DMT)-like permease
LFCAVGGVATNQLLFFNGLSLTSPLHASLIMTSNPIAVLILSAWLEKKAIAPYQMVGAGIGAIGALMLILSNRGDQLQTASLAGDVMILINSIAWASYLVSVKPLIKQYSPIGITAWIFAVGCLLVIPFGYAGMDNIPWRNLTSWQWFSLLYVVVAVTFLTYLLNMIGLHRLSPSITSVYIYFQPLFAVLIGLALYFYGMKQFAKEMNVTFIMSAALIVGGVLLVSRGDRWKKKKNIS